MLLPDLETFLLFIYFYQLVTFRKHNSSILPYTQKTERLEIVTSSLMWLSRCKASRNSSIYKELRIKKRNSKKTTKKRRKSCFFSLLPYTTANMTRPSDLIEYNLADVPLPYFIFGHSYTLYTERNITEETVFQYPLKFPFRISLNTDRTYSLSEITRNIMYVMIN